MSGTFYQFYPSSSENGNKLEQSKDNQVTGVTDSWFPIKEDGRVFFHFPTEEQRSDFVRRWDETLKEIRAIPSSTDLPQDITHEHILAGRFAAAYELDKLEMTAGDRREYVNQLRENLGSKDDALPLNGTQDKFVFENAPLPVKYEYLVKDDRAVALRFIEAAVKEPERFKEFRPLSEIDHSFIAEFGSDKALAALNMGDMQVARQHLAALEKETAQQQAPSPDKWTHTPVPGREEADRLHPPHDDWKQIEKYQDRFIGAHENGSITIRQQGDPSYGEVVVALDDSKIGGNRRDVPEANNIETARKMIDAEIQHRIENEHRATTTPHEEKTVMDGKQRLYYDEKMNHSVVPSDAEGKFPADNRNYVEFSNKAALDRYIETNVSRVESLKAVPTTTDLPKELSLESKNIQLHLKIYGVETVDKGTIKHDPKNPEPAQKYLAELRSGLDNKDGAKLNETQKTFLAESAPYLVHKSGNEALALRYIEASLKEPGKWGDLKPLSEKQHAVLEKHGSPEAKEAIKTGDYAFCRKQLDEILKKAEKDYKAKPLTDKQQAVIDKHGDEKLKEAVRTGNYGEARDFIASLHTKLEKEYNEKPLTEKQQTVVDKYAPENVKKAVQEGNPGEGRKYIAELHAKIDRDYSEKPLTEKQIIVLSKFADKTLVDEVKNGAFGKGRDYLDNLYKNANAEVGKYEKKVGDLAAEDKVNLQKAELFIIQNNHQQHREAIYGETMKSGISTDSLKKFVETLKPEKTNSTIPKSKGMDL